ncbi:MAG: transcription-repair coupling factor [Pseudomonadota bacterium]
MSTAVFPRTSVQRTRLSGLPTTADALALAQLANQHKPLIIITESASQGERLREEIAWFSPKLAVYFFPDWETLPYDHFSPHPDLVSERLETLHQISSGACDVAIIPVTTALYRLSPKEYLAAHTFFLKHNTTLDVDKLRSQLTLAGYTHTTQVVSPGEYSVRGGLIDLFPMGSAVPYRLDLLDTDIETIRTFDVDTQRSIYPVPEIRLLPAREFPLDEAGQTRFRQNFRERFEGDPSKSRLYKDISNGLAPAGIEYYLPLFFDATATLFEYLPVDAHICLHHNVEQAAQDFWRDTQSRYNLLRGDKDRPLLPPQDLFLTIEDFFIALKPFERFDLPAAPPNEENRTSLLDTSSLPDLEVNRRAEDPLVKLRAFTTNFKGRILLTAESLGRRETLSQYLAENGLKPTLCDDYANFLKSDAHLTLTHAPLAAGFHLTGEQIAVVTENELFSTQIRQSRRRDGKSRAATEGMLRDLSEVKVGDPVVHTDHGIARYQGLINLDLGEGATEFMLLEYAGNDKLYVPVSQLHLISRYSGASPESAPLHKLGSGQWEKAKRRAASQVRDTAAELLNLYAQRAARQGYAFEIKASDYDAFAATFPFEETPDQAAAIQAVKFDMEQGKPMDRLVCGDVGFGKTEVALRAAFMAVSGGKQVAILVPTTLLAEQHFHNFSDRFAEWPVKIAELSRFRSAKEIGEALKGLTDGRIDIVIGTHKLIQKDVQFKNLGLVIIDEEHRFGVRQKEQLKALRAEVDVLTLTATPIPRTLAMSLEGLRDFSVIATAPQKRLAIKTFVHAHSEGIIREAVLRELKRGGQIYYLYNEVETIQNQFEKLAKLMPEARIAIAHGQLRERELEQVMRDFYHQRFNVLLCSTIIETGIDVPSANTIIIHRADKFGLAQLHQLRGRVGRSHHQAYAYLLTPDEESLNANAKKRLEAIQMMEDLGAGFYLAMHDLEIRGAGEVLGDSQSGDLQEIGFSLYTDMLNNAVKSLKAGKEPDLSEPLGVTTEINLHAPALLPADYCGDIHERLVLYKRLANCEALDDLERLSEELIDRFGLPPEPTQTLLDSHRLRILSKPVGIVKIDATSEVVQVQFMPNPPIEPMRIIHLIQSQRNIKLAGQDRLRVTVSAPKITDRVIEIKKLIKSLT